MASKKGNIGPLLLLLGGGLLLMAGKKASAAPALSPAPGGTDQNGFPSDNNLGDMSLPRGIRNNNPGNIILTNIPWEGKIPTSQNTDGEYEQFTNIIYGIRAMIKNLYSYRDRGLDTITRIVSTWAPDDAATVNNYIAFVSENTRVNPENRFPLDNMDAFYKLVASMAYFENGRPAVSPSQFEKAMAIL